MVEKTCRKVFRLFCCPDYHLNERLPGSRGENPQFLEYRHAQTWFSPPPTLLIVNISNSTLNNCIIGNGIIPPTVAGGTCSCRKGQQVAGQTIYPPFLPPHPSTEPTYINIHDSDLKWVIIGNNNTMCTQQTLVAEADEA
ncbi:uncharacterized protein LOC142898262 [Nelusetta ayraudi]|uniref:uncharacterized protein LOC142898262 n=1 Tax=Nelusetta ayraudi TaxID=303726 RepID=UPI003F70E9D0